MSVTAKVRCIGNMTPQWEADQAANGLAIENPSRIVRLAPVSASGGGNAEWSKWTPSGYFEMHITNPAAFEQFIPGDEYLVSFVPASN